MHDEEEFQAHGQTATAYKVQTNIDKDLESRRDIDFEVA